MEHCLLGMNLDIDTRRQERVGPAGGGRRVWGAVVIRCYGSLSKTALSQSVEGGLLFSNCWSILKRTSPNICAKPH